MIARTRIKFCGMTTPLDVANAVAAGADAVGAIVSKSARRVRASELEAVLAAVPPFVIAVAVSANDTDVDLAALARRGVLLQFSGEEPVATCERLAAGRRYVKVYHVAPGGPAVRLDPAAFDAHPNALWCLDSRVGGSFGGTGRAFDWTLAAALARERPVIVSGGLTAENVGACVRAVRPYAVDVRSGIETDDAKDVEKMRAFVRAVREADAEGAETVTVSTPPNRRP